jgi:hypothetical protein
MLRSENVDKTTQKFIHIIIHVIVNELYHACLVHAEADLQKREVGKYSISKGKPPRK